MNAETKLTYGEGEAIMMTPMHCLFSVARTDSERLLLIELAKEAHLRQQNFPQAARLRDIEKQLRGSAKPCFDDVIPGAGKKVGEK